MGNSRSKSAKAKSGSSKGKGEAPAKGNEEEVKALVDTKPAEGQETPTAAVEENSGQDTTTPANEDTGQPRAEETPPVVVGEGEEEGVADQSVAVEKEEVVVVAAAAAAVATSSEKEEEETVTAAEAKQEEVESCGDPRPPSEVGDGDGPGPLPDASGGDDGDESPVPPSDGDVGVSSGCDADGGGAGDGAAVIQEEHADRVCAEVDSVPTSLPAAPAECDEEVPQMEDSIPAAVIGDANGTEPKPQTLSEDTSQYVPRLCNLCKWPDFDGYGFNLHAEKEKPGQYIGIVDPDSPAELGGLKEGDRIIEVNGDNIEASNHTVVIQKIKSKGDKTSMLVVDKATDDYFKGQGQTICSSMTSVVVISTPPRLAETGDRVTAMVAEQVESAPVPDEIQTVQNGTEEVAEGVAAVCVEGEAEVAPPKEIVGGGGVVDYHPYEEMDVTSTAAATTTVVSSYQEEAGTATNGMNGGSVGEAAVVSQTSEAEPAVIHSTTTTTTITTSGAADGDLNLNLSAAEMKERLKMRKKQDPRHSKTSFETKYKMFEKM